MRSYSLIETVIPKQLPTTLLTQQHMLEKKAIGFWNSKYSIDQIDTYTSLVCEGNLLLEFDLKDFIYDNLTNVLQAAIGAGVEVGGTVTTGGGGVVAEAANDLVFFGMNAGDALLSIRGVFTGLEEIKDSIAEIFASTIESTPLEIYESVQRAIATVTESAEELSLPIDTLLDKLGTALNKMIRKIAKAAGDAIAVFVPIPGTDVVIQNVLAEFADDAFTVFTKIYEKIPAFLKDWLHSPSKLKNGVQAAFSSAVEWLNEYLTGTDDRGWIQAGMTAIAFPAQEAIKQLLKVTGAAPKIIKWIKSNVPGYIDDAIAALQKLYPMIIGGLSASFVLSGEDY
jgi:hypothetical protein